MNILCDSSGFNQVVFSLRIFEGVARVDALSEERADAEPGAGRRAGMRRQRAEAGMRARVRAEPGKRNRRAGETGEAKKEVCGNAGDQNRKSG